MQTNFSLTSHSLRAELRALWAVFWREWVILLRYPSWIISLFIWPVIFPLTYVFSGRALAGPTGSGLATFAQTAGTQDFLGYILIGSSVWMMQNMVLWDVGSHLRQEQMRGTLESNWLSPTRRFSFLLGPGMLSLLTSVFYLGVSVLEFGLVFGVRNHGSPALALLVLALSLPSIYGLGFAFASLVIAAKETNAFVFLARGLVMIFCGVTFPIVVLPEWMQSVARWLPQTYVMQAMRSVILSGATFSAILPDLLTLAGFGLFWLTTGYLLFHWMDRRTRKSGALGQF